MEKYWLRKEGNDSLVIFALGWAADHRIVEHLPLDGHDVLCLYDYTEMEPMAREEAAPYRRRTLCAWSFGVWAAERLLSEVDFTRAVALNGTPLPVDENFGIPLRVLDVTLRGLQKSGMELFDRRAYCRWYEDLAPHLSPRGLDANLRELQVLRTLSAENFIPTIRWDAAIVGTEDQIFPPENMARYWGSRTQSLPLPHYPFGDVDLILHHIDQR